MPYARPTTTDDVGGESRQPLVDPRWRDVHDADAGVAQLVLADVADDADICAAGPRTAVPGPCR